DLGAFGEGFEFRPCHAWRHHRRGVGGRTKAAIGAGDYPLTTDDVGIVANALGHEPRVLNEIGRRVDHSWDQHLVVGNAGLFQVLPLVLMAGVGGFEAEPRRLRLEAGVDDFCQGDVVGVRAFVVPQQMCSRMRSAGRVATAALSAATLRSAIRRNSSSVLSRCWLCRADPRSGQSSCNRNPAAMIASYSVLMTSARAWR